MLVLALALVLDWFFGEPDALWKRAPHPVVLIGGVIDRVDRLRGGPERSDFFFGLILIAVLAMVCAATTLVFSLTHSLLGPLWWLLDVFVVFVLVAQRSLYDHVKAVGDALKNDGLEAGRRAVSMIVGRDVSQLDRKGVLKAALESLAENFSDGVVAPAFWYLVFGLPGILFYKAINTADSMVGHCNEKYEYFGKPAAVLDDVLNWPAARLSALLVVLSTAMTSGLAKASQVWRVTLSDAPLHRSPNAGWPETAFAVTLDISLGGPRRYGDDVVNASALNAAGRKDFGGSVLFDGLRLFRLCCFVLIGLCLLLGLLF